MILTERLRLVLSLYPWVWGHEMVDWISSWFEIRTRKYRIRLLRLLAVLFRILPGGVRISVSYFTTRVRS